MYVHCVMSVFSYYKHWSVIFHYLTMKQSSIQIIQQIDVFCLFFLIQEIEALQEIINQLLDRGYTSHCCRLAAEFGVYNKNLAIVVVCIYQERPHLSLAVKVTTILY